MSAPDSLLIDDDIALCEDLRSVARDAGLDLEVAHTWSEGVNAFLRGRHQLVICDYNLPGPERGLMLLAKAKRLRPETRLILISGYLRPKDEAIIEPAGLVDRFVAKGTGLAEIVLDEMRQAAERGNIPTDWKTTAGALRAKEALDDEIIAAVDRVLRAAAKLK